MREHLQAVARITGKTPPELDLPDLPPSMRSVWWAFLQLHGARPSGGMGPAAIPPTEILAWQQLNGIELTPFEIDTLLALDAVALRVMAPQTPKDKKKKAGTE